MRQTMVRRIEESSDESLREGAPAASEAKRQEALLACRRQIEVDRQQHLEKLALLEAEQQRVESELKAIEEAAAQYASQRLRIEEQGDLIAHRRKRLDEERARRELERRRVDEDARLIEQERARLEEAAARQAEEAERLLEERARSSERQRQLEELHARHAAARERLEQERRAQQTERRRQVDALQQHYTERSRAEAEAGRLARFPSTASLLGLTPAVENVAAANDEVSLSLPADGVALRRSPRFNLRATVELRVEGRPIVLAVRNISMSGVLVSTDGHEVGIFAVGSEHPLTLFSIDDLENAVEVKARVVRQGAGTMAFDWSHDVEATFKMALLIEMLAPPPVA